jgi:endonuclease/exonuclease/phosphatase family metal-dependent hydrolase
MACVLGAAGLSGFAYLQGGGPSGRGLTVMTFNIRLDTPADGPNAWPRRKDLVLRTIEFHQADIVGAQEALRGQVADLEAGLPGHARVGVGRDDGASGGEFNPIFFSKGRFDCLRHSTFWLSNEPDRPGSRGWDAACNRIVTWAELRDRRTGSTFFAFNTHFDHMGETARRESAALLLRRVAALAGRSPVVVTGDFNCAAEDEPYRLLTAGVEGGPPLADARALSASAPYGGTSSFNGFRPDPGRGAIIDFVFVRPGARVVRAGVIVEKWDGRFASDHYPVLAEVDFGAALPGR